MKEGRSDDGEIERERRKKTLVARFFSFLLSSFLLLFFSFIFPEMGLALVLGFDF